MAIQINWTHTIILNYSSSMRKTAIAAFTTSLPVLAGYLSIGFAFGFLLVKAGFMWFWAPVMSVIVFAGAAQFLAVGMLSRGSSPLEMGLAVLLINARHMVYGFSLLERFRKFRKFRSYLIFGLTDETYGLLTSTKAPEGVDRETFDTLVTAFNQSYWVTGSTLGALLGSFVIWDAKGIEFSMTALFTVLLVEQIRVVGKILPFAAALSCYILVQLAGIHEQALLVSIVASAGLCLIIGGGGKSNSDPREGAVND